GTFFVVCSIVGRRYSVDDYFKASSALQDDLHHPGPNLIVVLSFQLVDIRNLDKRGGALGLHERRAKLPLASAATEEEEDMLVLLVVVGEAGGGDCAGKAPGNSVLRRVSAVCEGTLVRSG